MVQPKIYYGYAQYTMEPKLKEQNESTPLPTQADVQYEVDAYFCSCHNFEQPDEECPVLPSTDTRLVPEYISALIRNKDVLI